MDSINMTREDLYLLLKERAPNLATGKSRARREEIINLLTQDAEGQTPAVGVSVAPHLKKRKGALNVPPTLALVKSQRSEEPFSASQSAVEKTRRGLEMLEIAANAVKMSGMSARQIGALLYIHCGLEAGPAGEAVIGLIGLRAALLGQTA